MFTCTCERILQMPSPNQSPLIPRIILSSIRHFRDLPRPQQVSLVTAAVGLGLLMLLPRYLKRKRCVISKKVSQKEVMQGNHVFSTLPGSKDSPTFIRQQRDRSMSIGSDYQSTSTLTTLLAEGGPCTPQQLGLMGMEALEAAIGHWQDAQAALQVGDALPSVMDVELTRRLESLIDEAYKLQDVCERLFLHQNSLLFTRNSPQPTLTSSRATGSLSSLDSFFSAQSDVGYHWEDALVDLSQLELYEAAAKVLVEDGIPFRALRTEMVGVTSDQEFLIKVHCIRLGYRILFEDSGAASWFASRSRQIVSRLFCIADKDPTEFQSCFDIMMAYLSTEEGRQQMNAELRERGLKAVTFYDVILDYVMEAFEILEDPPSSIVAVARNRWLSDRFKESALSASIWSALQMKRKCLSSSTGYQAKFYDILNHFVPVVAWGFLGPNEHLRHTCLIFKEEVMTYIRNIFSFHKVHYTTVEQVALDLWALAKTRYDSLCHRLAISPLPS